MDYDQADIEDSPMPDENEDSKFDHFDNDDDYRSKY